jgi:hypothetical protein
MSIPSIRIRLFALIAVCLVAGCGSGHRASKPPRWIQQANAVCKRDDPEVKQVEFDSLAMIAGLHRETSDLAGVDFFSHLPRVASDVEIAGPLLVTGRSGDYGPLRKADRALLDARRVSANKGVHCSFASDLGLAGV